MQALLAKLVPVRDWIYAGIAVLLIVAYNVHVHSLEKAAGERVVAAATHASDEAKKQAAAEKAAMAADYDAKLNASQEKLDAALKNNVATHAADLAKLQQYARDLGDAYRALQGASGPGVQPGAPAGSGSAEGVGQLPEFAIVSLGLADALRNDDALLASCRADRDALTGK